MNQGHRAGYWLIAASFVVALLLDTLALPGWLDLVWPSWLTLVLVYWCMRLPQRVGVTTGWTLGLLVDLNRGALLGQHALALALVAFLTVRTHRQLRQVPIWQQALSVLVFVLIDKLLLFWINGMLGYPPGDLRFLLPVLTTLLVWPLLVLVLSDLSRFYHVD